MKKQIIASLVLAALLTSPAHAADKYEIHVNTKKCNVSVYKQVDMEEDTDGVLDGWVLVDTVKCSVGKKNTPTPTGTFKITSKKSFFRHDETKYNYVSYFSGKCAFHTVPYYDNEYHNESLGHKRSAGCVRLSEGAAKWIYKKCKIGTTVIIK